jgi:hypothetical protein
VTEPKGAALLRVLDAHDAWERATGEKLPDPENTGEIKADAQACGLMARQMEVPAWFAWECLREAPLKEARGIRDWVLQGAETDDYDPIRQLYRYARKRGREVDEETYAEAQAEYTEAVANV